ncbi:MAG: arginine decarboxylase [Candidatus Poribacteria bacterium]|nr:arginine decarboxylase [Candidatus Poribacteria bacterium]
MVPKQIFLTKGMGKHKEKLTSFEMALRAAGIAQYNLVKVSSIFPPGCKIITKERGLKQLSPGEIVFCVMSENSTNEPHRLIAASVGLAVPKEKESYGYLSEHHSFGQKENDAGEYAESLAAEMLATTLGVEFDENASWDEQKEYYRISDKIVKTTNICQTAIGDKNGLWTTVISVAVLIPDID